MFFTRNSGKRLFLREKGMNANRCARQSFARPLPTSVTYDYRYDDDSPSEHNNHLSLISLLDRSI